MAEQPATDRGPIQADLSFVVRVHYRFVLLQCDATVADLIGTRGGQQNGLCGAAVRGALAMTTGLHTGPVPFSVSISGSEPPVGREWEEVVEVSFEAIADRYALSGFDDAHPLELRGGTTYRARYCATGLDAASAQDARSPDEPALDRYLLQMWPAPAGQDTVVRVTSLTATYWHEVARTTPPPRDPADLAAERLREEAAGAARVAERQQEWERRTWGGSLPGESLRAGGGVAAWCARLDRPLADRVTHLGPAAQRDLAVVAATWAAGTAGDTPLDWRPALRALAEGAPLPPPFDDHSAAQALLGSGTTRARFGPASELGRGPIHAPLCRLGGHPRGSRRRLLSRGVRGDHAGSRCRARSRAAPRCASRPPRPGVTQTGAAGRGVSGAWRALPRPGRR